MYLNNVPGGVMMQFCNDDGWSEEDISLVLALGGEKKFYFKNFRFCRQRFSETLNL